jgi:hypothetical protein
MAIIGTIILIARGKASRDVQEEYRELENN